MASNTVQPIVDLVPKPIARKEVQGGTVAAAGVAGEVISQSAQAALAMRKIFRTSVYWFTLLTLVGVGLTIGVAVKRSEINMDTVIVAFVLLVAWSNLLP